MIFTKFSYTPSRAGTIGAGAGTIGAGAGTLGAGAGSSKKNRPRAGNGKRGAAPHNCFLLTKSEKDLLSNN